MKRVLRSFAIICFLATLATFASCNKSNEKDLILGTWKCVAATSEPTTPWPSLLIGGTVTFTSSNTALVNWYDESFSGPYSIADHKLTIVMDDEPVQFDIKKLDRKHLVLTSFEDDFLVTLEFEKQ